MAPFGLAVSRLDKNIPDFERLRAESLKFAGVLGPQRLDL
jgi:hypothetical protein